MSDKIKIELPFEDWNLVLTSMNNSVNDTMTIAKNSESTIRKTKMYDMAEEYDRIHYEIKRQIKEQD